MSKELFLKNKKLANDWRAVAHGDVFEQVLTHARSQIAQQGPSREELRGVELLAHTLLTICDSEEKDFVFPSPGLIHYTESMPEDPRAPKPKRSKKG